MDADKPLIGEEESRPIRQSGPPKKHSMEQEWKYVSSTGRYYRRGDDRKYLVVGGAPPCCWFFVFQKGAEIAHQEGLESIQAAQEAAEAV